MRHLLSAFTAAAVLLTTPAVLAAPTCQNKDGDTVRCGTPGAMPVGWTLPPEQRLILQRSKPTDSDMSKLLETICVIGVFFALLALMPEFEGRRAGDWDEQEGDDEARK